MKFKITRNLGLKVAALIFSVFFWLIVINVNDPVTTATYANIPVDFVNEEVVRNMGKVYDLVGDPQTVRVTVSGKRSVLARVRTSNISAIADLSQMEVSTYLVPITAEVKGLEGETVTTQVNPVNRRYEEQYLSNFRKYDEFGSKRWFCSGRGIRESGKDHHSGDGIQDQ